MSDQEYGFNFPKQHLKILSFGALESIKAKFGFYLAFSVACANSVVDNEP